MIVYTVTAYRYADRDAHNYLVGVYSSQAKALDASKEHEEYRGQKYTCRVLEVEVDNYSSHKIIKEL